MIRLALLMLAAPAASWACECAVASVCQLMQTAPIVFWGETVGGGLDPDENAWSGRPSSARLKVLEAFRGVGANQEYVDVSLGFMSGMCSPMPYRLGSRTLVFLSPRDDGQLWESGCAASFFADEESPELALVRRVFGGGPPTIAGTVLEELQYWSAGAGVRARNSASEEFGARTDENGYFEFSALSAGRYTVSTDKPGYPDSEDATASVDLDASGCAWVDLHLSLDNSVSGRVVGPDGRGVGGVPVHLLRADGDAFTEAERPDITYPTGNFSFDHVEPGRYYIAVSPLGPGPNSPYATSYHGGNFTRESAAVIDVGPTSEIEGVDLQIGNGYPTRQVSVVAHWGGEDVEASIWCRQLGSESSPPESWMGTNWCDALQDHPVEIIMLEARRHPLEVRRQLTRERRLWIEPGTEDVEWVIELSDQDFERERR